MSNPLFEPFKQTIAYGNLCFIIFILIISFHNFFHDQETWYSLGTISHNSNQELERYFFIAKNNYYKLTHNILLTLEFFVVHTGMCIINSKLKWATTFGSFYYDQGFGFISAIMMWNIYKYWIPINEPVIIDLRLIPFAKPFLTFIGYLGLFLAGYAPLYLKWFIGNPKNKGKLCDKNLFGYVRHPAYLGFILFACSRSLITLGSLLFSILIISYTLIACIYDEEPRMVKNFGAAYLDYMDRVPGFWLDFSFLFCNLKNFLFKSHKCK